MVAHRKTARRGQYLVREFVAGLEVRSIHEWIVSGIRDSVGQTLDALFRCIRPLMVLDSLSRQRGSPAE